jgi:hypothetical protein
MTPKSNKPASDRKEAKEQSSGKSDRVWSSPRVRARQPHLTAQDDAHGDSQTHGEN